MRATVHHRPRETREVQIMKTDRLLASSRSATCHHESCPVCTCGQ